MKMLLKIGSYLRATPVAQTQYNGDKHWFVLNNQHAMPQAIRVLEAVALQLLDALPANGAQTYLFESKAGQQFSQLKYLYAATEHKIGHQLHTPRDAAQLLQQLNLLISQRYALLASANCNSIAEYNQQQRKPEPIKLVVISGVAALIQHDTQLIYTLRNILDQGAQVGVVLLLLHQMDEAQKLDLPPNYKKAFYEMLAEMKHKLQGFNFYEPVIPFNHPQEYQQFIYDFGYAAELPAGLLQHLTAAILDARHQAQAVNPHQDFIKIKIGTSRAKDAYFSLGAATDVYHAMLSGASRSGKTSFTQNLVLMLCEQYPPETLQLLILDFGTVTFHPYTQMSNVKYVFDQPKDAKQIIYLMHYLVEELERRKNLFAACGRSHNMTVDNLGDYQKLSGSHLPRLLVVIDEFGSMMANREYVRLGQQEFRVNSTATDTLNLIAREGGKAGVHLFVMTQSFRNVDVPADLTSNPHVKIGLKARERSDATALFKNDNDAAYTIERYQAVLNVEDGVVSANQIVDLDYLPTEALKQRQDALRARYTKTELSDVEIYLQQRHHLDAKPPKNESGDSDWLSA